MRPVLLRSPMGVLCSSYGKVSCELLTLKSWITCRDIHLNSSLVPFVSQRPNESGNIVNASSFVCRSDTFYAVCHVPDGAGGRQSILVEKLGGLLSRDRIFEREILGNRKASMAKNNGAVIPNVDCYDKLTVTIVIRSRLTSSVALLFGTRHGPEHLGRFSIFQTYMDIPEFR
jgi:hypothetical protein